LDPTARLGLFRSRAILVCGLFLVCAPASCSQKHKVPGQLIVAIDTDMALPDQIDTIDLQIVVAGTTLLDYPMPVGAGSDTQPIPATLTLVAGPDPNLPVTVRVMGQKNGITRTLRQVITTVPADRIATLRMPVQWLCDGSAQAVAQPDGSISYQSTCGPNATCKAGQCVVSQVPQSNLEEYQPQAIFGGGSAPPANGTTAGTCFDTVPCMVSGTIESPDSQCTLAIPGGVGGANVNIALRVANDGICDTTGTTCFVPLDGNSTEGWTEQSGRVALPSAVCDKLRTGLIAGVVVSTTCATKTLSDPPCGSWSSVAPVADASVPVADAALPSTTPILVAATAPEAGATSVCCPLTADGSLLYTCLCDGGSAVRIVAIDPASGATSPAGEFVPKYARQQYAAVLAGGALYWADRVAGNGGDTCPVYATPTINGGTASTLGVVKGDVYDGADLLADATALYALADNISGLAPTASAVQALRIDRSTGAITTLDTGGARPVFQFTQDSAALYLGVDTDVGVDGGVERVSRIVRIAKTVGGPATLVQRTLTTSDPGHGGFIGLQDDGTTLFALYEAAPAADGTIDTQVLTVATPGGNTSVLYDETVDSTIARLRILGVVGGAVLLVRDVVRSDGGVASSSESTVLVIPAAGGPPRIVASFLHDTPVFELQTPTFSQDVFWMNGSGRVFRLPAAGLR